jgi:uncharacterized membrane protein
MLTVKPARWFGIIVLFTVVTMLTVYFVPSVSPFFIFRYVFSFVFIMILPGYCLVSVLFPAGNKIDLVEKAVLSVALSFSLVGISGLFLGLSPIGMNFTSISVSLCAIVLVLAAVAFLRKRSLGKSHVQSSEQVST